jgi:hypothetical protein
MNTYLTNFTPNKREERYKSTNKTIYILKIIYSCGEIIY